MQLPPPPPPVALVPSRAKVWGTVSIVCGVLGFALFPFVFGPIALIFGILAVQSRYRPGWVGILLGAGQIVYVVVVLVQASEKLNSL